MVTQDIAEVTRLLDIRTGEVLQVTVPNIATVIHSARAVKAQVNEIVQQATAAAVELSQQQGTKTLHGGNETIEITGGPGTDYDPLDLMEALRLAGCPEDRISAAVEETVSYKVNRSVLRQLAAANPDYRAAIELAELEIERPYRAAVKLRRQEP